MGITPNDIQAQRELLERGERILEAQKQQAERARLRDTFAAAALTGLIVAMRDESMGEICESAYGWADATLRERARSYEQNNEKRCDSDTSGATLTDAEREAVEVACQDLRHKEEVATLRGLLERAK